MSRSRLYNTLLNLDYEDILRSCDVNDESRAICDDPVFWEDKAQQDYETSLRQVASERSLNPREKYLAILSQKDVVPGSEEFVDPQDCLRRAVVKGRADLCDYLVTEAGVEVDDALIEATRDKELFDSLVKRYNVDIYANPDLLFFILLEAIRNKNFPLVKEIAPQASSIITDPEDIEDLLNEAAITGDYEFIDYISDYFPVGDNPEEDADQWILQAALLKNDKDFAEDIINDMLTREQITELARVFVRAGDYDRLKSLINLADFEEMEYIGRDILLDAVRYDRLSIVRLVAEDRVFQLERRRSWFEEALDVAKRRDRTEIVTYLTNLLRTM